MIEWREVARGEADLRLYRVEARVERMVDHEPGFDPVADVLRRQATPAAREVLRAFPRNEAGPASFQVACHVVSLPDALYVVDSTFRTAARDLFPGVLEKIAASEGRSLAARPLHVLYTHAHFDHIGGHAAVEALGEDASILAHPFAREVAPHVASRRGFFAARAGFFRDCGLEVPAALRELEASALRLFEERGLDPGEDPWPAAPDGDVRIDRALVPEPGRSVRIHPRIEVFRFDGHLPGHLCPRVDGRHLISGDMWLPGAPAITAPRSLAWMAGVAADACGLHAYAGSAEALLALDVDACTSHPSHGAAFVNPKRLALRDLEVFARRLEGCYAALEAHRERPLRVLDLARAGAAGSRPIWRTRGSLQRLVRAYADAAAYAQDLAVFGDLEEVEPDRYRASGRRALGARLGKALLAARRAHGHLETRVGASPAASA